MSTPAKIINDNFHHHATFLQSQTPGMMTITSDGFSYSDSGLSCDTFNILYITDALKFRRAAFKKAVDHYEEKRFEYCVWINEENLSTEVAEGLATAGLQEAEKEPGMIINLDQYNPGDVNYDVRKLNDEALLKQFARIVSMNWQPPDQHVTDFYNKTAAVILNAQHNIEYFGSFADGKLVSVVELFPDNDKNAGVYSLCTLSEYRCKGIGTGLLKYCLSHLKNSGYESATLQAAADGLSIYQRLGFKVATTFHEFKKAQ